MKYNFDELTDRRGSGCCKWNVAENELPMWIGDMDFETAPAVKAALVKRAEHGIFGYCVTPDCFFDAVADFFERRYSYRPSPDAMVFSSGVVPTISAAVRKLTTPAENVLVLSPVYNVFYNCILNNGRAPLECELVYDCGAYSIDFADLEEKLSRPQTSLMIMCNPHNPVGKIWTSEELARVGALCKKYGVTVVADEIHCTLTDPKKPRYTPFASVNEVCRDISISCVSATKAFNIAGLHCSVAIAHNPVLRHKIWRELNTSECGEPNCFALPAAIAAFTECDEWLDELCEYIFENRRVAAEYIEKNIPELKLVCADATYFLWIDVSGVCECSKEFCAELRRLTGLFISDGVAYGSGGKCFVRVNIATSKANVLDGLSRLSKAVKLLSK